MKDNGGLRFRNRLETMHDQTATPTSISHGERDLIQWRHDLPQWLLVLGCFFLSGVAGLIYEICWIRIASLSFGSTTFALSTVLATFFLGLAIGSHFVGKFAQRSERPLLTYALLEICLAGFAFITPALFEGADWLFGIVYRSSESTGVRFVVRFLLVAVVMLPPSIMMGATFPLFCRYFVRSNQRIAMGIASLYATNTLGAAIGCALTGFYLLPHIGTRMSLSLGCGISLFCGVVVLLLPVSRRQLGFAKAEDASSTAMEKFAEPVDSELRGTVSESQIVRQFIPFLFFLVGFSALGMEIVWARYLSLLVDNSVYTYTITLTVTLLGIVIGSLLVSRFFDGHAPRARFLGAMQVGLAISVVGLMMTPPSFWQQVENDFWLYGLLLIFPAVFSGASFPLAIRMAVNDVTDVARTSGSMAACNTLGGISGSIVAGFLALPALGLHSSMLLITAVSLFTGCAIWLVLDFRLHRWARWLMVAVALAVWVAIPHLSKVELPQDFLTRHGKVLHFVEGYGANISIVETAGKSELRIDGHWQGSDVKSHQIMGAHIPMLLQEDPKRVAVLGIGPGQTASRFLMYDIDHLSAVDIEPRLFDVVREHFDSGWMNDPRTEIVKDDGRSFLAHTDQKFDLISIELGQVFRPGVAAFYTLDFYQIASARLNDNGMVSQFIPISFFSTDEFRSLIKTFVTVFPESTLWYNRSELLLIGRKQGKIELSPERFLRMPEQVKQDLQYSQWGGADVWLNQFEMFAGGYLIGPQGLAELSRAGSIYRDDLPELDYAVSRTVLQRKAAHDVEIAELVQLYLSPVEGLSSTLTGRDARQQVELIRRQREYNVSDLGISFLLLDTPSLAREARFQQIAEISRTSLMQNPRHIQANRALAGALLQLEDPIGAERYFRIVVTADPNDFAAVKGLANSLHRQGKLDQAIEYYEQAIGLQPRNAEVHNDYGIALAQLQRLPEAIVQFSAALQTDPQHANAATNLEMAEKELESKGTQN
jgi:spermidine synthase